MCIFVLICKFEITNKAKNIIKKNPYPTLFEVKVT